MSTRYPFLRNLSLIFIALLMCRCATEREQQSADVVNPLIGTLSEPKFSHGNTYPSITLPFGMTAWTPQTGEMGWIYQHQLDRFQGLRATHQPSPWMGDYGQFSIMPMTGMPKTGDEERSSLFSHEKESAHPFHYQVELEDYDIQAELAPTTRGAMVRLEFASSDSAYVIWDASAGNGKVEIFPAQRKIKGYSSINSGGVPGNFACYWVATFDKDFSEIGTWQGAELFDGDSIRSGRDVGAFLGFGDKEVSLQVATSFISLEQAERNLNSELKSKSFDKVKAEAASAWNELLGRIEIEGATEAQRTTFYTAFYRILCFPRMFHEIDSSGALHHYSPYDGQVHPGEMYVDNGFWDTFRAVFPFYTLMFPETDASILRGLINTYAEGDWFPKWTSPGYRDVMIGTHAASLFADAWVKGIRDYDEEKAYEGMIKDALSPPNPGGPGRSGNEYYQRLGYVPSDRVHEATARTLEFAYGDFCVGQMAKGLGKENDYRYFAQGSYRYKNVFDPEEGFMRGREASGNWRPYFSPSEWGGPFTEGSSWHYSWSVQHDPRGLIDLMGGKEAFAQKLDSLFRAPPVFEVGSYNAEIHEMTEMVAGNMGQYAHGNQPVHHLIYLYNYAQEPWKTQYWAREVMNRLYGPGPDGLAGDEDNGQMSAWYVFSALGFYPVCPGVPQYVMGAPLFPKVSLQLPNGEKFIIEARGNSSENRYIQSATLNGDSLLKNWLWHQEIARGGHLILEMGPEPNKNWGSNPGDVPFSLSDEASLETLLEANPSAPSFMKTVEQPKVSSGDRFFRKSQNINLTCATPGASIHYTLDGSFPSEDSPVSKGPVTLEASTTLRAIARKKGMYKSPAIGMNFIQLPHDYSIILKNPSHPRYTGGGPLTLLDGEQGSPQFSDGHWLGFQEKNMEATIDLGKETALNTLEVSFLRAHGAWIFLPREVVFYTSDDGENFEKLIAWDEPVPAAEESNTIRSFKAENLNASARYLRLNVRNLGNTPAWHSGTGGKAWLFVDEISIE